MLTTDIYGKPLSNSFVNATTAIAQKVKPRIVIQWLDSRHLDNLSVTTNDPHPNTNAGQIGFYFGKEQAFNGIERQSFTWAVAGAKDSDGKTITPDGTWFAMPSILGTDLGNTQIGGSLEYGWWSNSISNSNVHPTYSGYGFATEPYIQATFDTRKVNRIRIVTSEFYGQISSYLLQVYDASSNLVLSEDGLIKDGSYYQDHKISSSLSTQDIAKIKVTIRTTKNPGDRARIQEIIPIYETDITDYVIDYNYSRVRDVHQSSLPIGGSESAQASITIDNTNKDFNIFNSASLYGPYMKKDLKVEISTGWRVQKLDDQLQIFANTQLSSNISNSVMSIPVLNTSDFPSGGAGDYFTAIIAKGTQNEEIVLCSSCPDDNTIAVIERGYAGTVARAHNTATPVSFEIYEYVSAGTFYVDEWTASSSSMTVSVSLNDWSKYLAEKTINTGFFMQNALVGDAVENLLMRSNFPKADIRKLNPYSSGARIKGAIANYSFKEETIDRSGNNIIPGNGLRARFWAMPSGSEIFVRDIIADAIDKELSPLDKALGLKPFVSPTYVASTTAISDNPTSALELTDFTFTGPDGTTHSAYYNGVFDGFYVPRDSGPQYIVIYSRYAGIRVYLDDSAIINEWVYNTTTGGVLTRFQSYELDLEAGVPRKIRIEFFHSFDDDNGASFCIELWKQVGISADELIDASEFYTIVPLDSIGSRGSSFLESAPDRNKHRNNGVYINSPLLSQTTGLVSDIDNKAVRLASNSYIRIPYHESINVTSSNSSMYTGEWSIEFIAKFNAGSFSSSGEYISNWANSSPSTGFEFYYNSTEHGFKLITSNGVSTVTETVSSNAALNTSSFYHIVATYKDGSLKYYLNGDLKDTETVGLNPVSWESVDITIGGRGSSFSDGVGEVAPLALRDFTIDEFALYSKALSEDDVKNRYSESAIQPLTKFPFLYGNDETIRGILDSITFADLGRVYIDEENKARYEHFYRFFESSIDQHANVQHTISDSSNIVESDYVVALQCNKVTIPISGLSSGAAGTQSLWRASDPTTLSTVDLGANLSANANVVYVDTTEDPPFPTSGYIKIGTEVIKYVSKTRNSFNGLERGQFQTAAISHSINNGNASKVRECRYYNLLFDKAPAFNVKSPFITGILFEEPDEVEIVRFIPGPYGAELIIATGNNVPSGTIVFAEGTNPLTEKVSYTAIAGIPVVVTEQNSQITKQSASIETSIRKYGLKDVVIESPFINDPVHAQKIADFIISKTQDSVPILNINATAIPRVQLGDRIRISTMNAFDIINSDYWVIAQSLNVGESLQHTLTLRKVV